LEGITLAKRDWLAIHKSWQESGKSITSFCKENKLAVSGFYKGVKKHDLSIAGSSRYRGSQRKFVKAVVSQREFSPVVVELPNGLQIKLIELNVSVLSLLLSVKGS